MNTTDLKALIDEGLHHPEFNSAEVDADIHALCMLAVADGDIEIHHVWQRCDGAQEVQLFKRSVKKVLHELLADIWLAGCQRFVFKEYKGAEGNWIFGCVMAMDQ